MKKNKLTDTEKALREKLNEVHFSPAEADWANLSKKLGRGKATWYAKPIAKVGFALIAATSLILAYNYLSEPESDNSPTPLEVQESPKINSNKSTNKTFVKEKLVEEESETEPNKEIEQKSVALPDEESNTDTEVMDSEILDSDSLETTDSKGDEELETETNNPILANSLLKLELNGNLCMGEEIEVIALFENEDNTPEIKWEINGMAQKETSKTLIYELKEPGIYLVQANFQEDMAELSLEVEEKVNFDFLYEDLKDPYRDETVRLMASPSELNYQWDIEGFDNNIEGNDIMVDLDKTGVFEVELSHISESGCLYTISKPISIQTDFKTLAPTNFTPDGDGLNETFIPQGFYDVEGDFKFYVYNEKGKLVFLSNSKTIPWNGKENNNGAKLPEGNFVWKVEISNNGLHKAFTGKVKNYSF